MTTQHDTTPSPSTRPIEQLLLDAQTRIHRSIVAAFVEAGLDARTYFLLNTLSEPTSRGAQTTWHLRDRGAIAPLVERGLLGEDDGRVVLTERGREALAHLTKIAELGRSRATDDLTAEQLDALRAALTALTPESTDADAALALVGRIGRGRRGPRPGRPPFGREQSPFHGRHPHHHGHGGPEDPRADDGFDRACGRPESDGPHRFDRAGDRRARARRAFERGYRVGRAAEQR